MSTSKSRLMWIDVSSSDDQRLYISVDQVYVRKRTKFQDLWIVELADFGKSLFLDGEWQSSVKNEFYYHECLVHPAFVCHAEPKSVLILGGGEGATIREALKWKSVEQIAMVDIDGELVTECKRYLPEMHQGSFDSPKVTLIIQDAVDYINNSKSKWDIIISDLTSPSEFGLADRLYSQEYLQKCCELLTPEGFFVIQSGSSQIFSLGGHAKLASRIRSVFKDSLSYANIDGWTFIMASNKKIKFPNSHKKIDLILEAQLSAKTKSLDGSAILGMFSLPKHFRDAIN